MDGFVLTHAVERIDLPRQDQVDGFLPPFQPRQVLDPADPVTIGAMVGPEAFTEVKYLAHVKQMQALDAIPEIADEFEHAFGRPAGGLVRSYRADDAETIVVALGSVLGTLEDVVDELRDEGESVGAVAIKTFRPWPAEEVRAALQNASRVVVLDRALGIGIGGIAVLNVHVSLEGLPVEILSAIAGLGGRAITNASLRRLVLEAAAGRLARTTFLDLDTGLVDRELARTRACRRSGPHAENMLRDIGVVAAGPV
jgi:pyruvate ferredoxin oxidoreductase alpha subunit